MESHGLFFYQTCIKGLKVTKLLKASSLKGLGVSYKQKTIFKDNHGQKVSRKTLDFM